MYFENQFESSNLLAELIPKAEFSDYFIICSSLDSVPFVDNLAGILGLEYDLLFTEFIYSPNNKECEIGIVSETMDMILNSALIRSFEIPKEYVYAEANRKYDEKISKNIYKYRKNEKLSNVLDKKILLIDEGVNTGATALVCIKSLFSKGAKSITYATGVIAKDLKNQLEELVSEVYALKIVEHFIDEEFYYKNKIKVNEEMILDTLKLSKKYKPFLKEK